MNDDLARFVAPPAKRRHDFTRQQLYELVWSKPMRLLAADLGISDRGLAKVCASADIPVPARGHWNKRQAGKPSIAIALPPRGLGKSDIVEIGGDRYRYYGWPSVDHLTAAIPPEPVFETTLKEIRAKATALVGKAPLPKTVTAPHRTIAQLLEADNERRNKQLKAQYPSSWDAPIFDSAFEQRRLRLLNGLFICLAHCRMRPSIQGKQARELRIGVGDQLVSITLDSAQATKQLEREKAGYSFSARGLSDKMRLALWDPWDSKAVTSWADGDGVKLESQLRAIAIEIIVAGEGAYRQGCIRHREWLIERKADAERAEIQRKAEAEQRRKLREAQLQKQRIDHLLGQATAFQQAAQIRAYVSTVRDVSGTGPFQMAQDELRDWALWALGEADRIDPVVSGRYRERPAETGVSAED